MLLFDLGYVFWEPKTREEGDFSMAMLYAALTRGRVDATVLCAPVGQKKAYVDFLVESVSEYERMMNAAA